MFPWCSWLPACVSESRGCGGGKLGSARKLREEKFLPRLALPVRLATEAGFSAKGLNGKSARR